MFCNLLSLIHNSYSLTQLLPFFRVRRHDFFNFVEKLANFLIIFLESTTYGNYFLLLFEIDWDYLFNSLESEWEICFYQDWIFFLIFTRLRKILGDRNTRSYGNSYFNTMWKWGLKTGGVGWFEIASKDVLINLDLRP